MNTIEELAWSFGIGCVMLMVSVIWQTIQIKKLGGCQKIKQMKIQNETKQMRG